MGVTQLTVPACPGVGNRLCSKQPRVQKPLVWCGPDRLPTGCTLLGAFYAVEEELNDELGPHNSRCLRHNSPPVRAVRAQVEEFGGRPLGTLIGGGQTRARPRGALQRRARALPGLQRLLPRAGRDLPSRATTSRRCSPRPSTRDADGRTLLTALAVAYQVQCRLSESRAGAREGLRPHHAGRLRRRRRRRARRSASTSGRPRTRSRSPARR